MRAIILMRPCAAMRQEGGRALVLSQSRKLGGSLLSRALTRRAFVAGAACATTGLLVGCGSSGGSAGEAEEESYVSPYDWSGLVRDGEKLEYYEGGVLCSRWGIDVSEHQGNDIDWAAVAGAGVQFVFARIGNRGATEGVLSADRFFFQNAIRAGEVGIQVSAYFFSQAVTEDEAREEAQFALDNLRETEGAGASFAYVAYDHEPVEIEGARANGLSGDQLTANARAFCEVIAAAGYAPMLYGNQCDLLRLAPDLRAAYPVWLAEYDVEAPTAPLDFVIWQYTNAGVVPGIPADVDLNVWLEP